MVANSDYLMLPKRELLNAYATGRVIGCLLDHPDLPSSVRRAARYQRAAFKAEARFPVFATAPKRGAFVGSGRGKRRYLWKQYLATDPGKAMKGNQATGDCVSWGCRTSIDLTRCWQFAVMGRLEEYRVRSATAMLYAERGHTGQGANTAQVANSAERTGILLEQVYDVGGKKYDFTDYASYVSVGMRSGRTGLPADLKAVTSKNLVKTVSEAQTDEEVIDALYNGFGCCVGSMLGVASTGSPLSRKSGSWAHCMGLVGFDDTPEAHELVKAQLGYDDAIIFWDQSWGNWNKVINIPDSWQPWGEGMFALSLRDTMSAIRNGECMVFSAIDGFEARDLDPYYLAV